MATEYDILDLQLIATTEDPDLLVMSFSNQRLKVTKQVLEGIALWMRANQHNGGYYSLVMGDVIINAARPYKNHHLKHKERLSSKLARFKSWVLTNQKLVVKANAHHSGGHVSFEGNPSIRVSRQRSKDYVLEVAQFIQYKHEVK